jgi:hypothetical protein
MRLSAPLRVRGEGGAVWRVVSVGLPALAVASLGLWGSLHLGLADLWAWVLASKLAALTGAALALRRPGMHGLAWDGQQWLVDGQRSQLRVMLDLGPWMLLQARPDSGSVLPYTTMPVGTCTWLPLAASEAGPAWGALRAAVYTHPAPARPVRQAQDLLIP